MVDVAFLPRQRNVVAEAAAPHPVGQTREYLVAEKLSGPSRNMFEDLAAGVNAVTIIPAKDFIAAITGKCHRDMLASHLRYVVSGQHGGVAERLFQRTCQMLDGLDDLGLQDHLVMIGAELLGDHASVSRFVEVIFLETNGESLDRAG